MSPINAKTVHFSRLAYMTDSTVLYPVLVRFVRKSNISHSIMKNNNFCT